MASFLTLKNLELSSGQRFFLTGVFAKCDSHILKFLLQIKSWWSHVNFKNTKLIFNWLVTNIKNSVTAFKRRFDHKHSHFFTKRDHYIAKPKGPASFFLKDVSEYKKTLREKTEDKRE